MSPEPGSFPAEPTAFPGPFAKATSLPEGDWNMLANGRIYTLTVGTVGGTLSVELSSGDVEDAAWDRNAGRLRFVHVLPRVRQRFSGYLLHHDDADPLWRIAGVFGDETVEDPQSGWYATRPRS